MKKISLKEVKERVKEMVQDANFNMSDDLRKLIETYYEKEESPQGKEVLEQILKNAEIAAKEKLALCQDTGLAVFFVEVGEDVRWEKEDGLESLKDAIEQGMIEGYQEGYLRKSVVEDPIRRKNTGNNAPAFIHWELVPGDVFRVQFIAKGGGSENMSKLKMMKPADGREGIIKFVVDTISEAGPNPCPPIIVGVGIGGSFDYSALLAKKALLRKPLGSPNPDPFYAEMEKEILEKANKLGIGPQGMGGRTTVLAVHIEAYPCHIASMPVAVNIQCHSHRVREFSL